MALPSQLLSRFQILRDMFLFEAAFSFCRSLPSLHAVNDSMVSHVLNAGFQSNESLAMSEDYRSSVRCQRKRIPLMQAISTDKPFL
jgi:hypothetical protein